VRPRRFGGPKNLISEPRARARARARVHRAKDDSADHGTRLAGALSLPRAPLSAIAVIDLSFPFARVSLEKDIERDGLLVYPRVPDLSRYSREYLLGTAPESEPRAREPGPGRYYLRFLLVVEPFSRYRPP